MVRVLISLKFISKVYKYYFHSEHVKKLIWEGKLANLNCIVLK